MDELSTEDHPDWWRPVGGSNAIDSVLERRSTIGNNGAVPLWQAGSATISKGKFFTRGMRGWLENIGVYCQDTLAAGGAIVVNIAPFPGAGILYTGGIVVGAGGPPAWRYALFRVFWNYDSMFIWWYSATVAVEHAYDVDLPFDGWDGRILNILYTPENRRPWIIATVMGETPGDVPVSGTLNVVPIPNTLSGMDYVTAVVVGPSDEDIIALPGLPAGRAVLGIGQLTCLIMTLRQTLGVVPAANMEIHIVTDGNDNTFTVAELLAAVSGVVNTTGPISMGINTPATNIYQVNFSLTFPFRQSLHVYVENTAVAGNDFTVESIHAYEFLG